MDSLFVFVRDEQEPTFTADQFRERYLPSNLHDPYVNFLETRKFTDGAVVRDTSNMGNRLRRRRFKFGADIELTASPEALNQKVEMDVIDGPVVDGQVPQWTRIIIRDRLTGEQ